MTITDQIIHQFSKGTSAIDPLITRLKLRDDKNRYTIISEESISATGLTDVYKTAALLLSGFDVDYETILLHLEKYHATYARLFDEIGNNTTETTPLLVARQIESRIYDTLKQSLRLKRGIKTDDVISELSKLEIQFTTIQPDIIAFIKNDADSRPVTKADFKQAIVEIKKAIASGVIKILNYLKPIILLVNWMLSVFEKKVKLTPEALAEAKRAERYVNLEGIKSEYHLEQIKVIIDYSHEVHPIFYNGEHISNTTKYLKQYHTFNDAVNYAFQGHPYWEGNPNYLGKLALISRCQELSNRNKADNQVNFKYDN